MGPQTVGSAAIVVIMVVAIMNSIRAANNAHTTVQLVYDETMGPASIWQAVSKLNSGTINADGLMNKPPAVDYAEDSKRTRNSSNTNTNTDDGPNNNSKTNTQADLSNSQQLEDDQQQVSDAVPPYMQHMTHILVILHCSVFITGLIGNALVCLSVYRNKSLQTVTNYYIVNLAVADFLVILICLPPTVYWDLTLTWNFGLVLCKLVPYLQSTSVSVSVLTLTCISLDRWYAICRPLEFCSTKYRAKVTIALIWLVSMLFTSPDLIYLTTKPLYVEDNFTYMDCTYSWPETRTKMYQLFIVILLFIGPFVLMSISYWHIINVLWRNETVTETLQQSIQFEDEQQFYRRSQLNSSDSAYFKSTAIASASAAAAAATTTVATTAAENSLGAGCNTAPTSSPGDLISINGGTSDSVNKRQHCSFNEGPTKLIRTFASDAATAANRSKRGVANQVSSSELQAAHLGPQTSGKVASVLMTGLRPTINEPASEQAHDGMNSQRDASGRQTSLERQPALSSKDPPPPSSPSPSSSPSSSSSSSSGQSGSSAAPNKSAGGLPTNCGQPTATTARYRRISVLSGAQRCASETKGQQVARQSHLLASNTGSASEGAPADLAFALSSSSSSCASYSADRLPRIRQFAMSSLNNGPDLDKGPKNETARAGRRASWAPMKEEPPQEEKGESRSESKGRSGATLLESDRGNYVPVAAESGFSAAYAPMCESESEFEVARRPLQPPPPPPPFQIGPATAAQGGADPAGMGHFGSPESGRICAQASKLAASGGRPNGCKVDSAPLILQATAPSNQVAVAVASAILVQVGFDRKESLSAIKGKLGDSSSLAPTRESELGSSSSSARLSAQSAPPRQRAGGAGSGLTPPSAVQASLRQLEDDGGSAANGSNASNAKANFNSDGGCFQRCFEAASLVGPLKRKGGQSVGTYKTSKKYRQNLANYAAQRDKYRQKQESVTLRSSMQRGVAASITTPTNKQTAHSMAPQRATTKITENLATTLASKRAGHTKSLPAKRHLKPATVQQQQQQPISYSVGPRSTSLMAGEQLNPTADGSLQANQSQQQQSTNNIQQQAYWSHTRFCKLIESRKKAAKMLIVIVIMFGLCYLPVHFLNILRYTVGLPQNDITLIASLVSHWLCYFNSAVNPLIYNLMSGKFRHEFANLFFCKCFQKNFRRILR